MECWLRRVFCRENQKESSSPTFRTEDGSVVLSAAAQQRIDMLAAYADCEVDVDGTVVFRDLQQVPLAAASSVLRCCCKHTMIV